MSRHAGTAWAELKSLDRILLIPSTAWEKALLPHIADYEAFLDTSEGRWTIPPEALAGIASSFESLSDPDFSKAVAGTHFQGISIDIHRAEFIRFLHEPGLRWRFVEA